MLVPNSLVNMLNAKDDEPYDIRPCIPNAQGGVSFIRNRPFIERKNSLHNSLQSHSIFQSPPLGKQLLSFASKQGKIECPFNQGELQYAKQKEVMQESAPGVECEGEIITSRLEEVLLLISCIMIRVL